MIAGINAKRIQAALPIASRMLKPRELLIAGALTRMGIGLLRMEENLPTAKRKPELPKDQKWASLFERIFIEGFGVPLHVLSVYLFQEPVAKLLEGSKHLRLPSAESLKGTSLSVPERKAIAEAMQQAYAQPGSRTPHGIIARQIYERQRHMASIGDIRRQVAKAITGQPQIEKLPSRVAAGLNTALMGFQRKLWVSSAATLGFGILSSAILTGYVLQWLNDYPVSKKAIPWLLRTFKLQDNVSAGQLPGASPQVPPTQTTFEA